MEPVGSIQRSRLLLFLFSRSLRKANPVRNLLAVRTQPNDMPLSIRLPLSQAKKCFDPRCSGYYTRKEGEKRKKSVQPILIPSLPNPTEFNSTRDCSLAHGLPEPLRLKIPDERAVKRKRFSIHIYRWYIASNRFAEIAGLIVVSLSSVIMKPSIRGAVLVLFDY